jgi:hypothetical protein
MHVHCWDGTYPGLAWLPDAGTNTYTSAKSLQPVTPAAGTVSDPDVVLLAGTQQVVLFFAFTSNLTGNRVPVASLYNYDCPNDTFTAVYSLALVGTSHVNTNSTNIDVSDNNKVVVTWENNSNIYGMEITVGATTLTANSLVTVATGGGYNFRDPDITINSVDTVTVTYIGDHGAGQDLFEKQNTLSNFNGGLVGPPNTLVGIGGSPENFGTPRIASGAGVTCPGGTGCDNDYAIVVDYFDGTTTYEIWGYGTFDGNTYSNQNINQDGSSPSIDCYINRNPVVAWNDGGIQVGWELHDPDSSCADDVRGTGCNGGSNGPQDYTIHTILQHLNHDLTENSTGSYPNSYSVFNKVIDSSSFTLPSITEGEAAVGAGLLKTVYRTSRTVASSHTPMVIYKENPYSAIQMKRGDQNDAAATVVGVTAYPNPFIDYVDVAVEGIVEAALCTVTDHLGRSYPCTKYRIGDDLVRIQMTAPSAMAPGVYWVQLRGSSDSIGFLVIKN